MAGITIARPAPTEYVLHFARYIDLVPEGDVLTLLRRQVDETAVLVGALSDRDAEYRYAEGKWSIKEVIGHVSDTERIFVYRALCFARGESVGLPAFDENEYVRRASFGTRQITDLVAELRTVRSIAYIIAGHERHHASIVAERYLPGIGKR